MRSLALLHILIILIGNCWADDAASTYNLDTNNNSNHINAETKPITKTSAKLWNLHDADLQAVIAEVSRVTGKNFIIDPRVEGKISIISSTPIADKELYQVFLSVLQISGYAAIPMGKITKIIPAIEAKTQFPENDIPIKHPPKGDDLMVSVVPIHYVPAEQLVPVLRPLMPQWSIISAYSPSNTIILTGRANNIKQLTKIIKQVDNSAVNEIDIVPLKHALAMDIANTLKDVIKPAGGIPNYQQIVLAPDDRSNSLLISGNKTDRLRLRLLIAKLDKANTNNSEKNTQVIYLSYLKAEDIVPILAGIAQANFSGAVGTTIGTITRPELDSTNPASNLVNYNNNTSNSSASTAANYPIHNNSSVSNSNQEGSTKPNVQIIAEPNTNSVIVNAPMYIIKILKSVITQLDIKPAQILIEALVAEVDERDIKNLGIEWGSLKQIKNENIFIPGLAILNGSSSLDDFQAQIYALAEQRKANILSTPSVVVLDNRQAKILIGKQVSVASTSYPNNGNGTSTASPYTTYDRVNVALHLYVRPQITKDNGIQLQIDQGNDTLDPASGLNTDNPIFKISSIVTSVHVESGDIIVLGGLTQDELGNFNNKIPILGDIPGIGALFNRKTDNHNKRALMVFIRPIILKTESDSLYVSGTKYNDLRQVQLAWLRSQDYLPNTKEALLPTLSQANLPRPFSDEPIQAKTYHGK